MLLTVIIPSYNCAKWLERAVRSTEYISGCDLEVIVVDDGSTDNTQEILKYLTHEMPYLRFFYKNNGGLSSARNLGILHANGSYILFLDADDEVIQCDLAALLASGCDMIRIGVEEVFEDKPPLIQADSFEIMTGREYLSLSFNRNSFYTLSCAYIYRLEWLRRNSLKFEDGLIHEDNLFTVQALLKADTILASPTLLYRYIRRQGSITTSNSEDDILSRIYAYKRIALFLTKMAKNEKTFDLRWKIYEVLGGAQCLASRSNQRTANFIVIAALLRIIFTYRGPGKLDFFRRLLRRSVIHCLQLLPKRQHHS